MKFLSLKLSLFSIALIFFISGIFNCLYADKDTDKKDTRILFTGSALGSVEPCG